MIVYNISQSSLFQMSAVASNKNTTKKDLRYPEIEEQALQFILDACESSLSKYNKFLQVSEFLVYKIFDRLSEIGFYFSWNLR